MTLLLEGKGGVYIQDRGVSRWDTCAAQAVIEAYGGKLCRLDIFAATKDLTSYTYKKSESNVDFVPGLANLTPYNAADPKAVLKGAPPVLAQSCKQVYVCVLCVCVGLASRLCCVCSVRERTRARIRRVVRWTRKSR